MINSKQNKQQAYIHTFIHVYIWDGLWIFDDRKTCSNCREKGKICLHSADKHNHLADTTVHIIKNKKEAKMEEKEDVVYTPAVN